MATRTGRLAAVLTVGILGLGASETAASAVKRFPKAYRWANGTFTAEDVQEERQSRFGPALSGETVAPIYVGRVTLSPGFPGVRTIRLPKARILGGSNESKIVCTVDTSVDVGEAFRSAMRFNLAMLGLQVVEQPGEGAWELSGELSSFDTPTTSGFLWNYVTTSWELRSPAGQVETRELRSYMFFPAPRLQCEFVIAAAVDMTTLDIIARLNREFFKAVPAPEVLKYAHAGAKTQQWFTLGLSGASQAVQPLLGVLAGIEIGDAERWLVIRALAHMGTADILPALVARYEDEDEDARWYILRAADYVGGDAGREFIEAKAKTEQDGACKELISRIQAAKAPKVPPPTPATPAHSASEAPPVTP